MCSNTVFAFDLSKLLASWAIELVAALCFAKMAALENLSTTLRAGRVVFFVAFATNTLARMAANKMG